MHTYCTSRRRCHILFTYHMQHMQYAYSTYMSHTFTFLENYIIEVQNYIRSFGLNRQRDTVHWSSVCLSFSVSVSFFILLDRWRLPTDTWYIPFTYLLLLLLLPYTTSVCFNRYVFRIRLLFIFPTNSLRNFLVSSPLLASFEKIFLVKTGEKIQITKVVRLQPLVSVQSVRVNRSSFLRLIRFGVKSDHRKGEEESGGRIKRDSTTRFVDECVTSGDDDSYSYIKFFVVSYINTCTIHIMCMCA